MKKAAFGLVSIALIFVIIRLINHLLQTDGFNSYDFGYLTGLLLIALLLITFLFLLIRRIKKS